MQLNCWTDLPGKAILREVVELVLPPTTIHIRKFERVESPLGKISIGYAFELANTTGDVYDYSLSGLVVWPDERSWDRWLTTAPFFRVIRPGTTEA